MQLWTRYSCKKTTSFVNCFKNKQNFSIYNQIFLQVGIGSAIPNATSKALDRGLAKIANADPDLLKKFPNWNSMKKASRKLLRDKEHQLVRNFPERTTMQTEMQVALDDDTALDQIWQTFRSCCMAAHYKNAMLPAILPMCVSSFFSNTRSIFKFKKIHLHHCAISDNISCNVNFTARCILCILLFFRVCIFFCIFFLDWWPPL